MLFFNENVLKSINKSKAKSLFRKMHELLNKIKHSNENYSEVVSSALDKVSFELTANNDFDFKVFTTQFKPEFISVTWLGTKSLKLPTIKIPAINLALNIAKNTDIPVLSHLPGRNLNKPRAIEILNLLKNGGVKNILAVQGEWSHVLEKNDEKCDFPYASDLVAFIKKNFLDQFTIGVAGYPDIHPHCENMENEIKHLKEKVSNGADFIITQASFDYDKIESYATSCKAHGISVPIFPGIFTIKSYESLVNMAKWCGLEVPDGILKYAEEHQKNLLAVEEFGLSLTVKIIGKILKRPDLFAGVHLYTMNDADLTEKVIKNLKNLGNPQIVR